MRHSCPFAFLQQGKENRLSGAFLRFRSSRPCEGWKEPQDCRLQNAQLCQLTRHLSYPTRVYPEAESAKYSAEATDGRSPCAYSWPLQFVLGISSPWFFHFSSAFFTPSKPSEYLVLLPKTAFASKALIWQMLLGLPPASLFNIRLSYIDSSVHWFLHSINMVYIHSYSVPVCGRC